MAFPTVTMESGKYICVRETNEKQLAIVDLANPSVPQRRPMAADSVIMHPARMILAVKAFAEGVEKIQVYNLEAKTKLKEHVMEGQVVLWKWINESQIGLVTTSAVYHWDLVGDTEPVKIFDRAANLASSQIISYKVAPDGQWCVLVGIAPGPPERPQLTKGQMQLWSVAQQRTQAIEAHAAAFASVTLPGNASPSTCIAFAQKTIANGQVVSRMNIIELGGALRREQDLFFPPEYENDFPIGLLITPTHELVYVITRQGLVFVFDLSSGTAIARSRFTQQHVFLCQNAPGDAILCLNRGGGLQKISINESTIVNYVSNTLNNPEVALQLARRAGLGGGEEMAKEQFERLLANNQYREAAELAAESPRGVLRTMEVVNRLKTIQAQPSPLLQYFGILLNKSTLNANESTELATLVLAQNKKHLLTKWMDENKLTMSEALGDLLAKSGDNDAALKCYQSAGASGKVVTVLAAKGDFAALIAYTGQTGTSPDYLYLLQFLMKDNPDGAVNLAKQIASQTPQPVPTPTIAELFFQRNMVREGTAFLLDALKGDLPEEGPLQTKVIEVNLMTNPQVADAILTSDCFSHYDHPRVAQLCERAGLYMRALQHYSELADIKRVVINTHAMVSEEVVEYFGSLSAEWALDCLKELLNNQQQNLTLAVSIAKEYAEQLSVDKILDLFEGKKCHLGTFYFLASVVATSTEVDYHCRYIEAGARIGAPEALKEVERMTRESEHLDPPRLKKFLMEVKLADMRPLINICDRFDMVTDMTTFLYKQGLTRYIEAFCQKVSPAKTADVCAALLDLDADENFVDQLIISVRSLLAVAPLVAVYEQRNQLKRLLPFLEYLVNEGSTDTQVHNALGKIMIETNNNPEHFVLTNPYYDPVEVGAFAEKRDPQLACVAYKRGKCDDELIACTDKHSLFKIQARYVVERKDFNLWARVLDENNDLRRHLIDQVVGHALPESKDPEQVSVAVKSFNTAGLQAELIELLEKIILNNSSFSSNPNLQILLLITSIKTESARHRVMDYIHRLDNFDGIVVGEVAVEYDMYEEAFTAYKKFDHHEEAMGVLIDNICDMERAAEYAAKTDLPIVWSTLGAAQLKNGLVADAIESYIHAEDGSNYLAVMAAAEEAEPSCWESLVKFLQMARKTLKEVEIDNELIFAWANLNDIGSLAAFIQTPHHANLEVIGQRCFVATLYEAAKVIFKAIPNWGRLASALVKLKQYTAAVDAARKANNIRTWKEICFACVEEKEFKLAQLCGLNIIVDADELEELSQFYLRRGYVDQLIALAESGMGSDKAHMGIFTELGALYARFRPERLMEHLKLFTARVNIPRLIRVCEQYQQWQAVTYLYVEYDEFDHALSTIMEHGPGAWEHVLFKDICVKVQTMDLYFKAIDFYIEEHPELLEDLLKVLEIRIDHTRVVEMLRRRQLLPLIKEYLLSTQPANLVAVNDAVNELLMEEEDFPALKESIENYDNFDQLAFAARLERHELTHARRIAIFIYKRNLRWKQALTLCKRDQMWSDAIEVAAQSGDRDLVETEVLRYFIAEGLTSCFTAALYTCYELVRPDVVMELAWMHDLTHVCMPFLIQYFRDMSTKVDTLHAAHLERLARENAAELEAAKEEEFTMPTFNMPLALPAPSQLVAGENGPGTPGSPVFGGTTGIPVFGGTTGIPMPMALPTGGAFPPMATGGVPYY